MSSPRAKAGWDVVAPGGRAGEFTKSRSKPPSIRARDVFGTRAVASSSIASAVSRPAS